MVLGVISYTNPKHRKISAAAEEPKGAEEDFLDKGVNLLQISKYDNF